MLTVIVPPNKHINTHTHTHARAHTHSHSHTHTPLLMQISAMEKQHKLPCERFSRQKNVLRTRVLEESCCV